MRRFFAFLLTLCAVGFASIQCTPESPETPGGENTGADGLKPSAILRKVNVHTDKARYNPGESVVFTADKAPKNYIVRYWHLGDVIREEALMSASWTWTPPSDDFKGYYVEIVGMDKDGIEKTMGAVAVDVSSDWTRFPRYGFLSQFGLVSDGKMTIVLENLKNHHINGLQYYDWMCDHHIPLAGTPEKPDEEWYNIISNTHYKSTVEGYINKAHDYAMASMFYDLAFGVMDWAADDGVKEEWYVFKDQNHSKKDYHGLSSPFKSSIYIVDPGNDEWLRYFGQNVDDVYEVFDFDGFHIDQLGNRGNWYTHSGQKIDVPAAYKKFINYMDGKNPEKKHAFNAVGRFAQSQIAAANTDFLYNEVWSTGYGEIKTTIDENYKFAPEKNSVLAAYMNYKQKGNFNTPAVLLMDAVTFALGGSHLELGEHMLCNEYFPNSDVRMDNELEEAILPYYDFLTGYENLLRDGAQYAEVNISSDDMNLVEYQPSKGAVNYFVKRKDNYTIVHLLNFTDAVHLDWRDDSMTQSEPREFTDATITMRSKMNVKKAWVATPDVNGGVPAMVDTKSGALSITIPVPYLKYWTMIVLETE